MKKLLVIVLLLCMVFPCGKSEDIMDEVTFVPGIKQLLIGFGAFGVYVTGEYNVNDTIYGKRLELPIVFYNYSPSMEFGLIVDSIIINGWDTKVDIPMHKRVSTKGKMQDTIHFYLSGAEIENPADIDSIILKCSMYDKDYYQYDPLQVKIFFRWIDGNVFWENGTDVFHTHYDCPEIEAFFRSSGSVELAFGQGHTVFCETCREQDGFDY